MANTRYGKNIIAELSDAQALPNATTADSTNMAYVGGPVDGQQWIEVYAETAISIATGQAFSIEVEAYSSDTAASAGPFFTTANSGGINAATGTLEADAHTYILHKTSADGQLDFSAGSLICEYAIPDNMFRLLSYDYVQLKYTTDANESSETITAFLTLRPH